MKILKAFIVVMALSFIGIINSNLWEEQKKPQQEKIQNLINLAQNAIAKAKDQTSSGEKVNLEQAQALLNKALSDPFASQIKFAQQCESIKRTTVKTVLKNLPDDQAKVQYMCLYALQDFYVNLPPNLQDKNSSLGRDIQSLMSTFENSAQYQLIKTSLPSTEKIKNDIDQNQSLELQHIDKQINSSKNQTKLLLYQIQNMRVNLILDPNDIESQQQLKQFKKDLEQANKKVIRLGEQRATLALPLVSEKDDDTVQVVVKDIQCELNDLSKVDTESYLKTMQDYFQQNDFNQYDGDQTIERDLRVLMYDLYEDTHSNKHSLSTPTKEAFQQVKKDIENSHNSGSK